MVPEGCSDSGLGYRAPCQHLRGHHPACSSHISSHLNSTMYALSFEKGTNAVRFRDQWVADHLRMLDLRLGCTLSYSCESGGRLLSHK